MLSCECPPLLFFAPLLFHPRGLSLTTRFFFCFVRWQSESDLVGSVVGFVRLVDLEVEERFVDGLGFFFFL